jgi:hypothetical protein
MVRTKTAAKQAAVATAETPALTEAEAALEERRRANIREREQAEAELASLEGEKVAALRDGASGRERARELISAILAQRELLTLLDEEARLIEADALVVRARASARALVEVEREICAQVERVAAAAAGVDKALFGLRAELGGFAEDLTRLLGLAGGIRPSPGATQALGCWMWWEGVAEVVGRLVFELRGCGTVALPLGTAGQRFAGPVSNPTAIIASLVRDLRRPEVLRARFAEEPALAEAVGRILREGGDR